MPNMSRRNVNTESVEAEAKARSRDAMFSRDMENRRAIWEFE
jgi:hypothetical protein